MRSYFALSMSLLVCVLFGCKSGAGKPQNKQSQADSHIGFDPVSDLTGRHPELVQTREFIEWSDTNGVSRWHETPADNDGRRNVIVQGTNTDRLFAAQIKVSDTEARVERLQIIDTAGTSNSRTRVLDALRSFRPDATGNIHAIRPVVSFANDKYSLIWEIELVSGKNLDRFKFEGGTFQQIDTVPFGDAGGGQPIKPAADDMANNELHHLDQFRTEAANWTQGATTIQDKARRILQHVKQSYTYDGTITHISESTWSDSLVRDANGRKGICDEWAVVQISYLRSLGIGARIKFLIWNQNGKAVGHACLEFNDGGVWRHMDALWNAFDYPARYRQSGATGVTVMDADYPLDSRSTVPAWGVPDPTGDGKLYPYGDYVINPAYPGNARPGYSN